MQRQNGRPGTPAGAELPAAADALAPLSLRERLSAEIVALKELDLDGLRSRWRKLFRAPAPAHLPKYLLFRVLAYRIQANALGDLDRESVRFLDQVARDSQQRRAAAGYRRTKAPPPIPPVPDRRWLKPGTILVREHAGVLHRVVVMENGFVWDNKTFRSLSEVAHAITGTNWNGPRFFGLRARTFDQGGSSEVFLEHGRP